MTDQPTERRDPAAVDAPHPQAPLTAAGEQSRVSAPVFRTPIEQVPVARLPIAPTATAGDGEFFSEPEPTAPTPAYDPADDEGIDDWADDDAFVVRADPWEAVTEPDGSIVIGSDDADVFDDDFGGQPEHDAAPAPADDADESDDLDDEDEAEDAGTDGPARAKAAAPSRRQIARERNQVRRAAQTVLDLASVDAGLRNTVATIVGVNPENTVELVVAIVTANSRDLQVVSDTKTIIDADPLEAGVTAAALGRPRLRQVWKLLTGLGILTGELPSSDAKAAIALVRAVHASDTDAARARIDQAMSLLRK